jgi:hypothetical protein
MPCYVASGAYGGSVRDSLAAVEAHATRGEEDTVLLRLAWLSEELGVLEACRAVFGAPGAP